MFTNRARKHPHLGFIFDRDDHKILEERDCRSRSIEEWSHLRWLPRWQDHGRNQEMTFASRIGTGGSHVRR
jgi:hypothetical protein